MHPDQQVYTLSVSLHHNIKFKSAVSWVGDQVIVTITDYNGRFASAALMLQIEDGKVG